MRLRRLIPLRVRLLLLCRYGWARSLFGIRAPEHVRVRVRLGAEEFYQINRWGGRSFQLARSPMFRSLAPAILLGTMIALAAFVIWARTTVFP